MPASPLPELLGLSYSPWSEKAKWALEARRVPYTFRQYAPLIGELALRRKLRRWSGAVTVPVLTDVDGTVHNDSEAIARWADARGEGPRLFPADKHAELQRYVALSERGLSAGRILGLQRMLANHEATRAMVPRALRGPLGPAATALGRFGVKRTLAKYDSSGAGDLAANRAALVEVLQELRASVRSDASLLGDFSFADIAMAQVLAFVRPPSFGLRMSAATRETFADEELAQEFADMVAWRDALYAAWRQGG